MHRPAAAVPLSSAASQPAGAGRAAIAASTVPGANATVDTVAAMRWAIAAALSA
jgi:hypothetical protein